MRTLYAIAIGSNRHGRHGAPEREVMAAVDALEHVVACSRIVNTAPLGPSQRRFANAVALVANDSEPAAMLGSLKALERRFGRRRGRRWDARVIDLDIVLWSGGAWHSSGLIIPHPEYRARSFVLDPLMHVAPGWRDPVSGLTVRQLRHRLRRARPIG